MSRHAKELLAGVVGSVCILAFFWCLGVVVCALFAHEPHRTWDGGTPHIMTGLFVVCLPVVAIGGVGLFVEMARSIGRSLLGLRK